ncbi:MAG: hypothetical protein R3236_03425, partial [Phycisphaeraceae bacterium]|nr:hypothetical protein [Phycisphaeraceae bacterium]
RSPAEWSPEPRPVPLAPAPQAADPSTPHPPEQSPEQTQKDKDSEQAPADSQNPTEAPAEKPSGDTPSNAVDADRPMARSHKTEVASSAAQPPGKDGSWSDRAGAAMDEAIEDLNS